MPKQQKIGLEMRYNAVLPLLTNVFIKCLESHVGKDSISDNGDIFPAQTFWFYEITFCLHEKCILLK